MADHLTPRAHTGPWRTNLPYFSKILLFVVAVLAGLLFASNASFFRGDAELASDLVGLVRQQNGRVEDLEASNDQLRQQLDSLLAEAPGEVPAPSTDLAVAGAGVAIAGQGLRVQMWDAPSVLELDARVDANDLVVHQQDLEGVINALRFGGAEGIAVQGHRISATTGLRCVGNVLLIDGRQYSPPYVIDAIGDPDVLQRALDESPQVQVYLQYVNAVGLGWQVQTSDELELPAATPTTFTYAKALS